MATNPFQKQLDDVMKGATFAPVTQDFEEDKGVAGRVDSLVRQDSPLMQLAATRASQQANARGLRNSSMAVGAGQRAVIETATPIATADASLYQNQRLANQNVRNQAGQFNAQNRTNVGLTGIELGQQESQFGRSLSEQARQFAESARLDREQMALQERMNKAQMANQRTIAQMDADNRLKLAKVEAGFRTEIAGNENIANAWGTMMQSISDIQNNPELDQAAKKTLIDNNIASFQSFTSFWKKVSGGAVDVSDLLNFGTTAGAPAGRETTAPTRRETARAPSRSTLPATNNGGFFDPSYGGGA